MVSGIFSRNIHMQEVRPEILRPFIGVSRHCRLCDARMVSETFESKSVLFFRIAYPVFAMFQTMVSSQ